MSVWKLRRAVAVVYPSLNITNHQSLSKKKLEVYEKNFILKPADPDIISRKLCGGCALTIESTFYRERKGFISREKGLFSR